MSYIATVLTRSADHWAGRDADLSDVGDLDALADLLREDGADVALCLLEEDDEYVAIVRVDAEADDPRVFLSDKRVLDATGVAARLFADALEAAVVAVADEDEEDDEESGRPEVEPVGDDDLLADLGVGAGRLVQLCSQEGMLPSDVIFAVAEDIGASDVLEQVRGV
ncbi:MAG TPA: tRNA adenosine deaminase-associated protein [Mycobacteriales bacterium]